MDLYGKLAGEAGRRHHLKDGKMGAQRGGGRWAELVSAEVRSHLVPVAAGLPSCKELGLLSELMREGGETTSPAGGDTAVHFWSCLPSPSPSSTVCVCSLQMEMSRKDMPSAQEQKQNTKAMM